MANILLELIKHPFQTSILVPESRALTKTMVRMADLSKAQAVVELGPGCGGFTEHILHSLPQGAAFFALDINSVFVAHIQKRCPGATVIHGNALDLIGHLADQGLKSCDSIISGLPFSVFEEELREQILKVVEAALSPGGRFVTYTYAHRTKSLGHFKLKQIIASGFDTLERSPLVWKNVPPAYVYCATKKSGVISSV
jgi:phosphatidylethanolamine/phosphatidyl-N-methylethanolamine N-methyltransferase